MIFFFANYYPYDVLVSLSLWWLQHFAPLFCLLQFLDICFLVHLFYFLSNFFRVFLPFYFWFIPSFSSHLSHTFFLRCALMFIQNLLHSYSFYMCVLQFLSYLANCEWFLIHLCICKYHRFNFYEWTYWLHIMIHDCVRF